MQAEEIEFDESLSQEEIDAEAGPPETPPEGPEAAPDEPAKTEEGHIEFSPGQQQFINEKIVGPKVAKQREAERAAEELRAENERLKQQLPMETRPEVPDMPDQYADDYEKQVQARDQAIQDQIRYDERQRAQAERDQAMLLDQYQKDIDAQNARIAEYANRSKDLGVEPEQLQAAGKIVGASGIGAELTNHIIADKHGPAITKYLADNPVELNEIVGMTPMQAAIHIETNIKPGITKKLSSTEAPPPPTETLKGGAVSHKGGPDGAIYE